MKSIPLFAPERHPTPNSSCSIRYILYLCHLRTFLEHHSSCHFVALDRLLNMHSIALFNDRLGYVRPPEDHQCNWEDIACREQLPFKIHSDPRHCVWFEVLRVA